MPISSCSTVIFVCSGFSWKEKKEKKEKLSNWWLLGNPNVWIFLSKNEHPIMKLLSLG